MEISALGKPGLCLLHPVPLKRPYRDTGKCQIKASFWLHLQRVQLLSQDEQYHLEDDSFSRLVYFPTFWLLYFCFLKRSYLEEIFYSKKERERIKKFYYSYLCLKKKNDTPDSQSELPFSICNVTSLILASFVYNFKNLFIYLAGQGLSCRMWALSCSMWDLVLWPGIKLQPPCIKSLDS